jgi:transposase-like protein
MFLNAISLVMVINMIHKQHVTESSYKCEACGKSFPSRDELYNHIHQTMEYRLQAINRFLGIGIPLI